MSFETVNKFFISFLRNLHSEDEIDEVLEKWEEESDALKNIISKEEKKTKRKSSKKKKPADAPKGARTAYIFFCMEERKKIKEEFPDIDNNDIVREMGRRWSSLDDKSEFQEMAEEDKKRFSDEMKDYEPSEDNEEKPKKKTSRSKTAYQFFCEEMRPQLKEEGFKGKELTSELNSRWKDLKEDEDRVDELDEYNRRAQEAKEKKNNEDVEEEEEEKPKKEKKTKKAKKSEEEKPKKKTQKKTKKAKKEESDNEEEVEEKPKRKQKKLKYESEEEIIEDDE